MIKTITFTLIALIAAAVYNFDKIENAYEGIRLERDIQAAYGNPENVPDADTFKNLANRALLEDLVSSGKFTREEAAHILSPLSN